MILSDNDILRYLGNGWLFEGPIDPADIQPASVDCHLASDFYFPRLAGTANIDEPPGPSHYHHLKANPGMGISLQPGQCVLGRTVETVRIPPNIVGRVEGKSSRGRLFLAAHSTAGFLDPGFFGTVTLELTNHSPWVLKIPPGTKICQIAFELMSTPADRPYGHPSRTSKYQGQKETTVAR